MKYADSYNSIGGPSSIPIDPVTGKELSVSGIQWDLTAGKKFDNKRNPYVGLPIFVYYLVDLPYSSPQTVYTGFSLDASLFLLPNNVVEEPSLIEGRKVSTIYTYNRQGMPIKSVRASDLNNTRLETIYEYY